MSGTPRKLAGKRSNAASAAATPLKQKSHLKTIDDLANVTYNSEDDSDYHPDEEDDEEEDFDETELVGSEEEEDDDDTALEGVFDKPIKKDGHCSSSSSVSLEDELTVDSKTSFLPDNLANSSSKTTELVTHRLNHHAKFGAFIHKHEIPRKFLHVSIGFATLYFYTLDMNTQIFVPYLSTACAIIFSLDTLRLNWPYFNKLYCEVVGFLMRDKEVESYNGVIWYLLGLVIAFQFSSKDIGVMAVLLLSWSDTAASTFGRAYGYLTPKIAKNKSLAGSAAAFVVGVLSCWLFYGYFVPTYKFTEDIMWTPESSYMSLPIFSLACGFTASLSEGIDILNWDDNFTIPVLSSIFLFGLVKATEIY